MNAKQNNNSGKYVVIGMFLLGFAALLVTYFYYKNSVNVVYKPAVEAVTLAE